MKPLTMIGVFLIASGVLCLGVAAMMSGNPESKAPVVVGGLGVFDLLLGAGFLVLGRSRGKSPS